MRPTQTPLAYVLLLVTAFGLGLAPSVTHAGTPFSGCSKADQDLAQMVFDRKIELYGKGILSRVDFLKSRLAYIGVVACHDPKAIHYCSESGKAIDELVVIEQNSLANGMSAQGSDELLRTLTEFRTQCPIN